MTPQFAQAVDSVLLYVLDLLEKLDQGGEKISPSEVRNKICGRLAEAEARLGASDDWRLAKYALVAWIDDMLTQADWEGRVWWYDKMLEPEFFDNQQLAHELFYEKARQAAALPKKDALEVFYICVVLGFRGLYRDPTAYESVRLIETLGLPTDVESWARQTASSLRLGSNRPALGSAIKPGYGAPPRESKSVFASYVVLGVVLAAANLTLALRWLIK